MSAQNQTIEPKDAGDWLSHAVQLITNRNHADLQRYVAQLNDQSRRAVKYLSAMFSLKCMPDLLERGLYPNVKEFTESAGAYQAIRQYICRAPGFELQRAGTLAIVVGDGTTPRTGAMIAMRSRWAVASVDPRLKMRDYRVHRLELYQSRVEDLPGFWGDRVVVVCVHSHATYEQTMHAVSRCRADSMVSLVAIPCCVPFKCPIKPDVQYRDPAILSPKNDVSVWYPRKFAEWKSAA